MAAEAYVSEKTYKYEYGQILIVDIIKHDNRCDYIVLYSDGTWKFINATQINEALSFLIK